MPGLLADIFSAADGLKRRLKDAASDPIGYGQQVLGQTQQNLLDVQALQDRAFDPARPTKIRDQQAFNALTDKVFSGVMGFAPMGIFVGPKAKTWNPSAADEFLSLEKQGMPAKKAWTQTGTFRSPDGMLRQEIDDSASKMLPETTIAEIYNQKAKEWYGKPYGQLPLNGQERNRILHSSSGEINRAKSLEGNFQHPALYEAYPQLKRIELYRGYGPEVKGWFDGSRIQLDAPGDAGMRAGLLHEGQHGVQQIEGFARGGGPNEFAVDAKTLESINKQMDRIIKQITTKQDGVTSFDQAKRLSDLERQKFYASPMGQYQRLAGEAESRAVERRANFTPEQRRSMFPLDDYDVPLDQLIIKGLLD